MILNFGTSVFFKGGSSVVSTVTNIGLNGLHFESYQRKETSKNFLTFYLKRVFSLLKNLQGMSGK